MSTPPPEHPENGQGAKTPDNSNLLYGATDNRVIEGHAYDGITEYDNPMPGWWVWIFVATVLFAPIYILGVHVFGFINDYEADLAASMADLETIREAHAAAVPALAISEAELERFIGDPKMVEAGAIAYAGMCAACHGDKGQGLIGPNLADEYYLHGGSNMDLYEVITDGVPAKGMPGWESALTPEKRAQVVAFIRSIEGTDPPNAKAPEGEPHPAS